MVAPWTIPKLVTWRVRDWASCFLACKYPLDNNEDGPNNNSSSNNHKNNNNSNINNIISCKRSKGKTRNKKRAERKLSLSPPTTTRHLRKDVRSNSLSPVQTRRLSWPPVSDEGFIVFCFDRDGGFDVLKEERTHPPCPEKTPRTVNRKLTFGDEEGRTEEKNILDNRTEQERTDNTSCPKNDDVSFDVQKEEEEEEEEKEASEDDDLEASGGSSVSNQSDGGRGSFAFPTLGIEWVGSPVQMPKSDDLCLKKQKPVSLGFQCCRF